MGAAAGRENGKCRSAAGRALAAGWRAAWSTCLPRGRVARYWSTSIFPLFFPSISIRFACSVGLTGVVRWFAGRVSPVVDDHFICAVLCFGRTRPSLVTLARPLPYGYGGRRLGWLHDWPTRWTMCTIFRSVLLVTIDGKPLKK